MERLPVEVLETIAESMDVKTFLSFCSTCRRYQRMFGVQYLRVSEWRLALELEFEGPGEILDDMSKLHYITASHVLANFLHPRKFYQAVYWVIDNGIISKYIGCSEVLRWVFRTCGVHPRVETMIARGATLFENAVDRAVLSGHIYQDYGPGLETELLVKHGASTRI